MALKGVNGQIKLTQSQLKDVEKLLKLNPGNMELIAQKHKNRLPSIINCVRAYFVVFLKQYYKAVETIRFP